MTTKILDTAICGHSVGGTSPVCCPAHEAYNPSTGSCGTIAVTLSCGNDVKYQRIWTNSTDRSALSYIDVEELLNIDCSCPLGSPCGLSIDYLPEL